MRTQGVRIQPTVQVLIAVMTAGLLAFAAAPIAQATSMISTDENSEDTSANPELTRTEIQFLEDYWILYSGVQVEAEPSSGENPSLIREQIQFFEDNWHLNTGSLMVKENPTDENSSNPVLPHDEISDLKEHPMPDLVGPAEALTMGEISFFEDKITLPAPAPDADVELESSNPALTREEIKFLEESWHLDGEDIFSQPETEDFADREEHTLTHPWGGDALYQGNRI